MRIKVTTEKLLEAAQEASGYIDRVSDRLEEVGRIVNASSSYWEGDGQENYVRSYRNHVEKSGKALNAFRENVEALKKMAGVYQTVEGQTEEEGQSLPANVIV